MSETGFESRLPHGGDYWSELASGIDDRAAPLLERRRRSGGLSIWWARAEWSPALACCAAICAISVWWFVPQGGAVPEASIVARALQPADPLAEQLLVAASAPDLAALVSRGVAGPTVTDEEE
jgi:hypothetical protein